VASKLPVNEKIDDALGLAPIPEEMALVPEIAPSEVVFSGNPDVDMEADLAIARQALHTLAEKGAKLFEQASFFAGERQDARSFEAAVQAQKEARDSILAVIDFHKRRKEIDKLSVDMGKQSGGDTTVNNTTVFVGTTTEILKMMKDLPKLTDAQSSDKP
jgi:hypothetical protein